MADDFRLVTRDRDSQLHVCIEARRFLGALGVRRENPGGGVERNLKVGSHKCNEIGKTVFITFRIPTRVLQLRFCTI